MILQMDMMFFFFEKGITPVSASQDAHIHMIKLVDMMFTSNRQRMTPGYM